MKKCSKCGLDKLESEFYKQRKGSTELCSYCKKCSHKSVQLYQINNRAKTRLTCKRADLKRLYGLTLEERDAMLKAQNGKCPVCHEAIKIPHVDHCHKSGEIRGILCARCNLLLGIMHDSPVLAHSAVDYLRHSHTGKCVPNALLTPKKILITGASGLIGSALSEICPENTVRLLGRDQCDLLRWADIDRVFNEHRPTHVIHLAAKVGGVQANSKAPAAFFSENVTINTHVVEACRMYGVKKLICFLSTCVFPDPCPLPLQPAYLHDGPPHPSNYGYAYAKRMLAVQCQTYNEQYGTNFVPVIPCNIYGPNDNFNLENSHVVPALIYKMWQAKQHSTPMTVWGSGKPLREFIFSGDIARLCMDLLDDYEVKEPIVLSTGKEHSIKDLVTAIADVMDFRGEIVFDASKPDGQFRKPSDNTPLRELYPNFRFTSLDAGIYKTVKWFKQEYPRIRQ